MQTVCCRLLPFQLMVVADMMDHKRRDVQRLEHLIVLLYGRFVHGSLGINKFVIAAMRRSAYTKENAS